MKKNILLAVILSLGMMVFSAANAQTTKEKQTTTTDQNATMQKGSTPINSTTTPVTTKETKPSTTAPTTTTKQTTPVDQTKLTPKELGAKVTDWMKVNIGLDEAQAGRVNVAATTLLTKVREIRKM